MNFILIFIMLCLDIVPVESQKKDAKGQKSPNLINYPPSRMKTNLKVWLPDRNWTPKARKCSALDIRSLKRKTNKSKINVNKIRIFYDINFHAKNYTAEFKR